MAIGYIQKISLSMRLCSLRPGRTSSNILAFTLLLASLQGCGINNIPIFEEAVNEAWIEVQSQYRGRAELVLQLMDVMQPLRAGEPEIYEQLRTTEDRVFEMHIAPDTLKNPEAFGDFRESQQALTEVLEVVFETATEYPEMVADDSYRDINAALQENAQLIDIARRDYWQKVERYNSELVNVPGRWWRAFVYPKAEPTENFDEP